MPTLGGGAMGGGADRSEAGKKRLDCDTEPHDTERSSISTTSSATSSSTGHPSNWTSSSANKLSKFGRRIRDSCRNLKGRQSQTVKSNSSHNPEDYSSFQLPNESVRSKVYVAMDFSGRQGGRILDNPKDVRACDKVSTATKDGYVPFRRRVAAPVADRLTETQATVHKCQAWFHGGMSRDKANKILQAHASTDGVFLVRDSSVAGGFVISVTAANKNIHSQVLPLSTPDGVVYSVDDGKTKFYDLLQLVEFYQLNTGSLPTRLNQYIVNADVISNSSPCGLDLDRAHDAGEGDTTPHSPVSRTSSSSDNGKMTENSVNGSGRRPQSPDSVKMAASSASEADSAMSQDGGSDDEGSSREQQG